MGQLCDYGLLRHELSQVYFPRIHALPLMHALFLSLFYSHYFVHGGWFEDDNHLLSRVETIRHIPATIVQGRYDVITPMKTAWELHKVNECWFHTEEAE